MSVGRLIFGTLACLVAFSVIHDSAAQDQDPFKHAIDLCQPKLVKVFGASAGRVTAYATGLIVSDDGSILTTQGVFLDGQQVRVVDNQGAEHQAQRYSTGSCQTVGPDQDSCVDTQLFRDNRQ